MLSPVALPTYSLSADALGAVRGGRPLFSNVAFALQSGEILQVEGSNGAGKTTLLNMVAGLLQPQAGRVYWCGAPVMAVRSTFYQAMTYLGHQHGLKAALDPMENLRWSLGLAGVSWQPQAALQVLLDLGLADVIEQPVGTLSAGQRRRVALARVWLSGKPVWILDEPLTALDRQVIPLIESRLQAHAEAGGLILLTAHQPMNLGERHRTITLEAFHA